MSEATFTFLVDEDLKKRFAAAAKSSDLTEAQLLRDFMRDFVCSQDPAGHDAWFRREVTAGLESANVGDVITGDEVETEAAAWRAETRSKMAGPDA